MNADQTKEPLFLDDGGGCREAVISEVFKAQLEELLSSMKKRLGECTKANSWYYRLGRWNYGVFDADGSNGSINITIAIIGHTILPLVEDAPEYFFQVLDATDAHELLMLLSTRLNPKCKQCGMTESELKNSIGEENSFYWVDENLCNRCSSFNELINMETAEIEADLQYKVKPTQDHSAIPRFTHNNIRQLMQFINDVLLGKPITVGKSYPVLLAEGSMLKIEIATGDFCERQVDHEFNVFVGKVPDFVFLEHGKCSVILEDWSIVIAFLKLLEKECANHTVICHPLDSSGNHLLTDEIEN